MVVLLCTIGAGVMYYMATRQPEGYTPDYLTDAQIAEAARIVDTQKFPTLLNLASDAHNSASQAARHGTTQAVIPPVTVTFTQDELNASLRKWAAPYRSSYEPYVKQPLIRLEEGRIVLMGTVPEYHKVLSVHLVPTIDEQGLHCELDSVRIGALPLPQGLFDNQRARVEHALKVRIPAWQATAKMDETGLANTDARAAALGKLVLAILNHEPSPPVLFLPKIDQKNKLVVVRISGIEVVQGALAIRVQGLTSEERVALLEKIKQTKNSASAGAD